MDFLFRSLAVHQAHFYQQLLANWGPEVGPNRAESLVEGLVYDGLWLTKFPLLFTPTYGVARLDALHKGWQTGRFDPVEALALRPLVDADLVRFVLRLKPTDYETPVEIFFGGRPMNKPLWSYLLGWFEHGAGLRGRLGDTPTLFDTVFR